MEIITKFKKKSGQVQCSSTGQAVKRLFQGCMTATRSTRKEVNDCFKGNPGSGYKGGNHKKTCRREEKRGSTKSERTISPPLGDEKKIHRTEESPN